MNNGWDIRIIWLSRCSLYVAAAAMPFSVLVTHIAILTFIICWFFEPALLQRLSRLKDNYQLLALIAFGLWMCAGISYSEKTSEAWFALERKAFFFLLPVAFGTSTIQSGRITKNIQHIFCYSCALALLMCYSYAGYQLHLFNDGVIGSESLNYLSSSGFVAGDSKKPWMFFSYVRLAAAINMHPTYLALYAAFCCIILVCRNFSGAISTPKQVFNGALIIFFSISIIFLASRIIVLMLSLFYLCLLVHQVFIAERKRSLKFLLCILLMAIIAGVFLNPVTRYRQVDEIVSNGITITSNKHYTNSTEIRASLWWLAAKTYATTNWFLGVGPGDVKDAVQQSGKTLRVTNVLDSYDPHNQYLFILLSSGLFGILFFMIYIGMGLASAIRNHDIIFLSFLVLFLIVSLTESVLELQKGIVFFTLFFATMNFQKAQPATITQLKLAGADK
ncbi:MAG TPA: O-antigen ligase family protein [Chryseosolibacter sp.]